ncbi:MAG: radical SAM protein [Symploca sp. SIO3C6]|uniref:Radical SAM protein n=1 Tax=Symploca sp. SIO1C4 TaxID=2607765 RepID=A0A6B3NCB1_9CYAN|nr:radical SAM protein [Symploca sp. SIO3C6]NER27271.1 radical SAM protein [Symploca sp. SIO1C4]
MNKNIDNFVPAEEPSKDQPITVLMIEAVGKCNAICGYCPRGQGLLGPETNTYITMDLLDKALDLASSGSNHAIYLHHRGEPFLHPKLDEIIRRVREKGFYTFLSTNLISATPDKVKKVLTAGINQIEMHYSAGLTRLPHEVLLKRIHEIRKLNWELRNFGCRLEMNFSLFGETREIIMEELSRHTYYDETLYVRWFEPHDWPSLEKIIDRGVDYRDCHWYKHKACAILSNGDIVICCLDQFSHSCRTNIKDIDRIDWESLADRRMCQGCTQHVEMNWLEEDAIDMPLWLTRKQEIDTWTA